MFKESKETELSRHFQTALRSSPFFGFFSAYLSARFSAVFTCGRRPTGHGEIPVVVVVVVVVGGGNNFPKKAEGGSHPILKS